MCLPSGRRVNVLDPHPETLLVEDIAHNLAGEPRYAGSVGGYTVGKHSLVVARLTAAYITECACQGLLCPHYRLDPVARQAFRCGLFHDGAEAYLRDVPLDVKRAMRELWYQAAQRANLREADIAFGQSPYDVLEQRFLNAMGVRFGVEFERFADVTKRADQMALAAEVEALWPPALRVHFTRPQPTALALNLVTRIGSWDQRQTERAWLDAEKEIQP